ncbi:hypothetical protein FOZ60_006946 [Perkinsus olseni]|uniref:Uncharacterized protein n=1 Tax=Perkinsus olseni TaxID=32597 RepID=A0A7J6PFL7_PEROL|nr:hypothetical protein FOZ60_006946 [Perkinsus olseni]
MPPPLPVEHLAADHPSSAGIGRFESSSFKKRLSGGASSSTATAAPPATTDHTISEAPSLKAAAAVHRVVPPPRRYEHRYSARGICLAAITCIGGVLVAWVMMTDVYRSVEVTPAMLLGVVTASIVLTQVFLTSRTPTGQQPLGPPPQVAPAVPQQEQQPQIKLFGSPAVSSMTTKSNAPESRQNAVVSYPDPRAAQDNPLSPPPTHHNQTAGSHAFLSTPHRVPSPYAVAETPSMSSDQCSIHSYWTTRAGLEQHPPGGLPPQSITGVAAADLFGHEVVSAWARTVASDVLDRQIIEPLIRMLAVSDSQLGNAVKVAGQGFFLACATVSDGGRTVTRPPMSTTSSSIGLGGEPSALPGAIYLSDRNLPHPLSSLPELNAAWKHRLVLERYFLLPPIQEADSISTPSGYGGGLLYPSRDYVVARVCDWATHGLRSGYQYDQKEVPSTAYGGRGSEDATAVPTTTCDTVTDSRILDHILLHALDCHMNAGGSAGTRPFTSTFVRSVDARDAAAVESTTAAQVPGLPRPPRWSTGGLGLGGRRGADSPVWIQRCYDTSTGIVTYNVVDATRVNARTVGGAMQREAGSLASGRDDGVPKREYQYSPGAGCIPLVLEEDHFSTLPNAFKHAVGEFPPPNPQSGVSAGVFATPSLPRYFTRRGQCLYYLHLQLLAICCCRLCMPGNSAVNTTTTIAAPARSGKGGGGLKGPSDRLSPDNRRAYDHDLGPVGTPVTRACSTLSPPSPSPSKGSDGIDRLAVLLKDSIMTAMETRLAKLEEDIQGQIGSLMSHVQMVDHRVEIARIEQKQLGEEVQAKIQDIQDALTLHRGQFLNAVATVEQSVASAVATELSRGRASPAVAISATAATPSNCVTPSLSAQDVTPHRTPLNQTSVASSSPTTSRLSKSAAHSGIHITETPNGTAPPTPVGRESIVAEPMTGPETTPRSTSPTETDQAIDLSTKLASSLSESGFYVHRESFNYIISWDTDALNLRRGYLMWAFKAAGFHKDAGIRDHHIPTLVSFMTRVVEIAGTAQSTLLASARREADEASTSRMFRQMVSQYPGMVTLREELGHWVANEGFDAAVLLMPHATLNPVL